MCTLNQCMNSGDCMCKLFLKCMDNAFICSYVIYYTIAEMSERCIHCGASDRSLTQPEYSKWVCIAMWMSRHNVDMV